MKVRGLGWMCLLLAGTLAGRAQAVPEDEWLKYLNQHAVTVSSDSGGHLSDKGLAAVAQQIGDARVVLLGEQSHGEENVFALKAALVEYLHRTKGFDVLVFESGLFDIAHLWQQPQPVATQAPGNLFYRYAGSPAVKSLLDTVDRERSGPHPLQLAGMDSQHTGIYSQQLLLAELRRQPPVQRLKESDWQQFAKLAQPLFAMDRTRPSAERQHDFFALIERSQHDFAKLDGESAGFWLRILACLRNQAEIYWQHKHPYTRSEEMGKNLRWLVEEKFAGKKVLVWGFSGHLNRASFGGYASAGKVLADALGEEAYMIHFTSNGGAFHNFITEQTDNILPEYGLAIEPLMAKTLAQADSGASEKGSPTYLFASWRKLPERLVADDAIRAKQIFYQPVDYEHWQSIYDGTFYLQEIHAE